ncbi:NAD(P)-binding protein [Peniophora sp. CONT]|nr:NAD(P)-binding protein [Peniophora sp. CONT]
MPSIFLIGATGYLGGSLLVKIRKQYPDWPVTALVRKEQHAAAIRATGVAVVQPSASQDQLVIIAEETYKADLTINMANCDDEQLCQAVLGAMKKKKEDGKPKGVFLHTSGTMLFNDASAAGRRVDGKYWNDNDESDMKNIDPAAMHGPVDTAILKAGEEGYVTNFTICPVNIVGPGSGPIRVPSQFVKLLVSFLLQYKQPTYPGEGSSRYNYVHIDDLLDLYMRVLDVIATGKQVDASSYTRFHIGDDSEVDTKTAASIYGAELARLGLLSSADLGSVPVEKVDPSMSVLAHDVRVRGDRGRTVLGWKPRRVDLHDTVAEDVKAALEVVRPTSQKA